MLARAAELTGVVGKTWIYHDLVARPDRGHPRTDGLNYTGPVRAHDVWEGRRAARQSSGDKDIEVIQCRSANRDAYLARLRGGRIGNIVDVEVLNTAARTPSP